MLVEDLIIPQIRVIHDVNGFFERRVNEALKIALEEARMYNLDLVSSIEIDVKNFCVVPLTYNYYGDRLVLVFHSISRINKEFGHTIEQLADLICKRNMRKF
jgi:hypothetical protein